MPRRSLKSDAYCAPVSSLKGEVASPASDLYAIACTLYECLAGRPPFLSDDQMKVLDMHLHAEPAPIDQLRTEVPPPLAAEK